MSECEICGFTSDLQEHHISYTPEVKQVLCVNCHIKIHNHGVGKPKGYIQKKRTPFHQKVVKQGGSRYIAISPEWFEVNGLNPDNLELLIVAAKDIRIVNPDNEAEVYTEISRIIREAKTGGIKLRLEA